MKKIIALVLTALLALSLVACGSETKTDDTDKTEDKTSTELTGTVSTDGSTSMEKVIGALSESFMAQNGGVTVNYNPTGSGSGITAVQEGTCDIGLSSRALKDSEVESGLVGTVLAYDGIAVPPPAHEGTIAAVRVLKLGIQRLRRELARLIVGMHGHQRHGRQD